MIDETRVIMSGVTHVTVSGVTHVIVSDVIRVTGEEADHAHVIAMHAETGVMTGAHVTVTGREAASRTHASVTEKVTMNVDVVKFK